MADFGVEWGKSLRTSQKRYFAKKRAMARQAAGALGAAVTVLETAIRKRVKPARRVNQQDSPSRRAQSISARFPTRATINRTAGEGKVTLTRHWTGARSKAVTALYRRFGQEKVLFRSGLLVKRTRKRAKGQTKGLRRVAGPGFDYVTFSRDKGLAKWAQRSDKGQQIRRHVIRLNNPQVIRALSITPGLDAARGTVFDIFRAAGRKAIFS